MFVHHIANLEDSSLAKEFYVAQKNNFPNYPSVVNEVEEFLNEWNVQNYADMSKNQFRQTIKDILYNMNRNDLLEWTKKYKKVDYEKCEKEKFETKNYFKTMNIVQSRLYFKVLNFITPTIRANFKSDKKFRAEKFICIDCREEEQGRSDRASREPGEVSVEISTRRYRGYPDTQIHQTMFCRANSDLRVGKNIEESEIDCVLFFQQLLERRLKKLS